MALKLFKQLKKYAFRGDVVYNHTCIIRVCRDLDFIALHFPSQSTVNNISMD